MSESPKLKKKCPTLHPIRVRFRNPVAEFLSACATVTFWFVYWIARFIIFGAACTLIFGLLLPRHAWYLLNHTMDQYHIERHFKDEL